MYALRLWVAKKPYVFSNYIHPLLTKLNPGIQVKAQEEAEKLNYGKVWKVRCMYIQHTLVCICTLRYLYYFWGNCDFLGPVHSTDDRVYSYTYEKFKCLHQMLYLGKKN